MKSWYFLKPILIFFFTAVAAFAWQVKGRPTIPSDCKEGETWVTDHAKSRGNWTAFCRVLSGGGSSSKAYKFWKSRFQTGRPYDWPFSDEKPTDWQPKDVSDVLWVVENTPECLWDPGIKGIYRLGKSKEPTNPGMQRKDSVVLYNPAFQNEDYLKRVFIHELAHKKFRGLSEEQRTSYAKSAGWKIVQNEVGDYQFEPPRCCFVRADASETIDENFANNLEFYIDSPDTLKKIDPKSYQWIEKNLNCSSNHKGPKT